MDAFAWIILAPMLYLATVCVTSAIAARVAAVHADRDAEFNEQQADWR